MLKKHIHLHLFELEHLIELEHLPEHLIGVLFGGEYNDLKFLWISVVVIVERKDKNK